MALGEGTGALMMMPLLDSALYLYKNGMSNCPGDYKVVEKNGKQIKSCINCSFPHIKDNYDKVNQIIKKANS